MTLSHPSALEVRVSDGTTFPIDLHGVAADPEAPIALLLPAMGVGARYYSLFADRLVAEGLSVALVDLRGQGMSRPRAGRRTKHGFAEVVEMDIPHVVSTLRERFPRRALHLIGHSLGGQLGLLAQAHHGALFDRLTLIASGSAWHRAQSGWRAPRHLLVGQAFATIARLLGYWPGDTIGFGGRQSAQMMIDCARQASTGSYRLSTAAQDYEAQLAVMTAKVLFLEIEGDTLTPPGSVEHLRSKLDVAEVSGARVPRPVGTTLGAHFAWVRHSPEVVTEVGAWLCSSDRGDGHDETRRFVVEDDLGPGLV